ncbi:MAG: rhodanese-like domain-containing protein [Sphingobacteriales bacterium]|nr:MAG: rhodanese-like domain-containing protein [Sphingobacteriales bacterium]
MKTIWILTGSALLLYTSYRTYQLATLDTGLAAKVAAGAVVLDVRTPAEYDRGHIDGSVHIPLGTLRQRYRELDTGQTYITCCSHGLRSVKAVQLLQDRGYRHVYNGGAWVDLQKIIRSSP